MARSPKLLRFLATIYRIWMLRYVNVPEEIGRALEKESGQEKHIPVVAIVNGRSTRTTLVPAGGGCYRLQFNATLRKAARADVGEVAGVELKVDREPRDLPVPPELAAALKTRPRLKKEFDRLPPGGRVQFLRHLIKAKAPATREKRVKRLLEILLERAVLRPGTRRGRKRD
ncbi:MAG: YdeI/OmpD-associated family protein [Candidatus Acidiferrales bacterium]